MREAIGNGAPDSVGIYMEGTQRRARLARDVEQFEQELPDGGTQTLFRWNEVTFPTELPDAEIEANFDLLWARAVLADYEGERAAMDDARWRADVDAALLDLMEVLA